MNYKIRLSPPDLSGHELKYIQEAIDSNWVAPVGNNIDSFEAALEDYLGYNSKVACLSSGTAAIHLALILAGVSSGDYVICQSLTFAASAFPILYQGAHPIFIDSEKETWNLCPRSLEKAIKDLISKGKSPRAIIVVHIFGMPAKMNEIIEISKKYNIPIIEDAAEAMGSEYKGQKCGTFGDFGILSFNGNKIITTSGGGALVTKSLEAKHKAIFLSTQSKESTNWYEHKELGFNYRMSNILAGIGRGQMKVLNHHISKRRANHQFYCELFKPYPFIKVFSEVSSEIKSNHWLTCIQIIDNIKNKEINGLTEHFKQYGIESKLIWKPLNLQPIFKNFPYYGSDTAEKIFKNGICLPSGSNLDSKDKELIAKVALDYLDS